MLTITWRRAATALTTAAAMTAALLVGVSLSTQAEAATTEGVVCETSASNAFNLTATSGYILTPDGNSIYMWGYAGPSGTFQLPGPTLCVPEGATVTITLKNSLREPVSVVVPGITGMTADGAPAQPTFDTAGKLTSLTKAAPALGGTVTYSFVASRAGTYLYESGTDVAKQVQMGLYGALIVRPTNAGTIIDGQAYDDPASAFDTGHEYLHLLSEIDPAFHLAVERNRAFDLANLRSRYFLINGRSMPDTIAPNGAAWLPSQPYGAIVHIKPKPINAGPSYRPALIRYLNAGTGTYPFHPHGNDQRVVGKDAYPLIATGAANASYEKFLIDIGPGQTVDTTLEWTNIEQWAPDPNPNDNIHPDIPVDLPALQDQIVTPDSWFSESPYLGFSSALPPNVTSNNQCGEYYHVAHSHALQQATNYGATFGGMMTLIRIDPPAGCPVTP
jgi:FtsP/CotA-like multicopper oxidase with cupredoxin domain